MACAALLAQLPTSLAHSAALCFVASDAMIGMARFLSPFDTYQLGIWWTYALAQVLLVAGVVSDARRLGGDDDAAPSCGSPSSCSCWRLPRSSAAAVPASATCATTGAAPTSSWWTAAREPVARVRDDFRARRGDWITLADTSPALRTAIGAVARTSASARTAAWTGRAWPPLRGPICGTRARAAPPRMTMQLAGLLDEDLRAARGRSFGQKVGQAVSAASLEHGWSKDQILEAYLNLVPFRGELVGLSAMSQHAVRQGAERPERAARRRWPWRWCAAPNAAPGQVSARACRSARGEAAAQM